MTMVHELSSPLPSAPESVLDARGGPQFGRFQGSFGRVDLSARMGGGLRGGLRRVFEAKRWMWSCVATDEVLAAFAVVDVGYASNAFAFVVDLQSGQMVTDRSFIGLPAFSVRVGDRPGDGAHASFRSPGARMSLEHPQGGGAYDWRIETSGLRLDARLDSAAAPAPLALVLPLNRGDVDATQKANLLPATGTLQVGGRTWKLDGGFGGLDYTQGLFPRNTAWRWAFALGRTTDGLPVGLNLAAGLSDRGSENGLWLGGALLPLGEARFTFDARNPQGPWRVQTEDGAVDLRFAARGMHREQRNLVVVKSRFVQVAGLFSGTVRDASGQVHELRDVPGVTEDQWVLW